MSKTKERLKALAIVLPAVGKAAGNHRDAVPDGHLVFASGQGPIVRG